MRAESGGRAGAAAGMALGGRAGVRDAGAAPGSLCRACSASAGDSARARRARPRPALSSRLDAGSGRPGDRPRGGSAATEARTPLQSRSSPNAGRCGQRERGGAGSDLVTSPGQRRLRKRLFLIAPADFCFTLTVQTTGVNFSVEKDSRAARGGPGDANSAFQRPGFHSGP